jgi:hypothetical protein
MVPKNSLETVFKRWTERWNKFIKLRVTSKKGDKNFDD